MKQIRFSTSRHGRQHPDYEQLEPRRLLSVNVTTYHYDNARDGANTNETTLTPSNVNQSSFGKVGSFPVDGQIYAQPLVMTNIAVSEQGTRNIVIVATENDSVYAFDAQGNNPAQGYLWKTSLLESGETAVPQTDYSTTDITPLIGITGTPVIDASTDTLYVVGAFAESNGTFKQRLYALDITSGATRFGGPVTLTASVAGTGYGSSGGQVTFSPFWENQRPALTLANGEVYIAWSSHGDLNPWHGWVMAYDASNLHQDAVYCDTADGDAGGIWMSGGGIAVDSDGNLYFSTGNGTFNGNTGGDSYAMSIEKMSPSLTLEDYFTPYNQAALSSQDLDYGCSSVVLLPNQSDSSAPDEILTESKWGTMYLNNGDTGDLGEYNSNGSGPNDDLSEATIGGTMHNTISYWNGYAFVGGDDLALKAYSVGGGSLGQSSSSHSAHQFGSAGGDGQGCSPTISSNGTSDGIVWAVDDSAFNTRPAVLYAYNADDLSDLLWSSNEAANGRDTCGDAVKFQSAVVANGYVYVGGGGSLTVYGLLSSSNSPPTIVNAAAVNPSPVTGTTADLTVLATDPSQDVAPTYSWAASTVSNGAATPGFSVNGTSGAGSTTATFHAAGNYTFTVTATDPSRGLTAISSVNVTVSQTVTTLAVSPSGSVSVADGHTQQFNPNARDQFGQTISPEPSVTWSLVGSGVGSINGSGLYQAPPAGTGTATVQATADGLNGDASVTVIEPTWLGTGSAATWNAATQVLAVTGPVSIVSDPGTDQPIVEANGSAAVITIDPTSATQIHLGGLSLTDGASAMITSLGSAGTAGNHIALVLGQSGSVSAPLVDIDAASKLDLADNDLIIHDGNFPSVDSKITPGFNSSAGAGIISSNVAGGSLFVLRDALISTAQILDGESVSPPDVEVRFTYFCDFDLNGVVDSSDYTAMDANYSAQVTGFDNGDFNQDGIINGSDYTMMDNVYNAQVPALDDEVTKADAHIAAASAVATPSIGQAQPTGKATAKNSVWLNLPAAVMASRAVTPAEQTGSQSAPAIEHRLVRSKPVGHATVFSGVVIQATDPAYTLVA